MSALAWVKVVEDDRYLSPRSDGYRPIKDYDEWEKVVNYHKWQHAYYSWKPWMGGHHPSRGITSVILKTMLNGIGYTPYVPVSDTDKKCLTCYALRTEYDWL